MIGSVVILIGFVVVLIGSVVFLIGSVVFLIGSVVFLMSSFLTPWFLLANVLVMNVPGWVDNAGVGWVWRSWFVEESFYFARSHQLRVRTTELPSCARDGEDGLDPERLSAETWDQVAVPEKDCWRRLRPFPLRSGSRAITSAPGSNGHYTGARWRSEWVPQDELGWVTSILRVYWGSGCYSVTPPHYSIEFRGSELRVFIRPSLGRSLRGGGTVWGQFSWSTVISWRGCCALFHLILLFVKTGIHI